MSGIVSFFVKNKKNLIFSVRKNKDRFNLIVQSGANFHCSRFESSKFNPGERFTGVVPIREWIPEIQNLSPLRGGPWRSRARFRMQREQRLIVA